MPIHNLIMTSTTTSTTPSTQFSSILDSLLISVQAGVISEQDYVQHANALRDAYVSNNSTGDDDIDVDDDMMAEDDLRDKWLEYLYAYRDDSWLGPDEFMWRTGLPSFIEEIILDVVQDYCYMEHAEQLQRLVSFASLFLSRDTLLLLMARGEAFGNSTCVKFIFQWLTKVDTTDYHVRSRERVRTDLAVLVATVPICGCGGNQRVLGPLLAPYKCKTLARYARERARAFGTMTPAREQLIKAIAQ